MQSLFSKQISCTGTNASFNANFKLLFFLFVFFAPWTVCEQKARKALPFFFLQQQQASDKFHVSTSVINKKKRTIFEVPASSQQVIQINLILPTGQVRVGASGDTFYIGLVTKVSYIHVFFLKSLSILCDPHLIMPWLPGTERA